MHSQNQTPKRNCKSSLSQKEWNSFFEKGYCVYKEALSLSEIEQGYKAMDELFKQAIALAKKNPNQIASKLKHNGSVFVLDSSVEGELLRLRRVCGVTESILHQLSQSPKLLDVFSDLLLHQNMEQLICQFHAKKPFDEVEFKPHRDITHRRNYDANFTDVNGYGSYAIGVIAFDDVSALNGGLHLIPQSHLAKDCELDISDDWKGEKELAYCPELKAGDVLFMHPYLIHWSTVNNSKDSRYSLLSGMACVGANKGVYPGDKTNCILKSE